VIDGIKRYDRWGASDGLVSLLYHRLAVLLKTIQIATQRVTLTYSHGDTIREVIGDRFPMLELTQSELSCLADGEISRVSRVRDDWFGFHSSLISSHPKVWPRATRTVNHQLFSAVDLANNVSGLAEAIC
jgi:hypothetical protein